MEEGLLIVEIMGVEAVGMGADMQIPVNLVEADQVSFLVILAAKR